MACSLRPAYCYNLLTLADTTVGLWMLGLKVNFFNDTRLCAAPCTGTPGQEAPAEGVSAKQAQHNTGQLPHSSDGDHGALPRNPHAFVCAITQPFGEKM